MRLRIHIDNMHHEIDSTNPETLGRWMVEIFGRIANPTPATLIRVEAQPSFIWEDNPNYRDQFRADWICDTRYFQTGEIHSPRELVTLLGEWLDKYEADRDRDTDS